MNRKKTLLSRRDAVKQLIKTHAIEDQATLIELLYSQYDIQTNQPAISRDLHEIGVYKGMIDGKLIYELPKIDIEYELLKLAVIDVSHNETMIAIKTVNGLASFVGDFLDRCENIELLGTIAGENMVFVSPASINSIQESFDKVCQALNFRTSVKK